jgi:hypothetical protein
VYYLETIPDEMCVANVSVGNNRSEVDDSNDKIKIIEAKAFRSVASWHERWGHLHGNAMSKVPVRDVKEDSKKGDKLCDVCVKGKVTKVPFSRTTHYMCNLH